MIKKILFITLSNIGDVILTLPVLDALRLYYLQAKITVMVGPRAKEIFENNPYIHYLIVYDKQAPLRNKIKLFFELKQERFDVVIDLKNSLFGALLPAKFKTTPFLCIPSKIVHMKERNLYRLYKALKINHPDVESAEEKSIYISAQDEDYVEHLLKEKGVSQKDKLVIVAPVARGANRMWKKEKFAQVCQGLAGDNNVILIGTASDKPVTQYIHTQCRGNVYDFAGLTNLMQLACLIRKADVAIVCDSGITHLASYLNIPVIAIFAAGDDKKYGPWSKKYSRVISREIFCRPCLDAQCRFGTLDCMRLIRPEDVVREAKKILVTDYPMPACRQGLPITDYRDNFKRILIARTDRIGDVLLSTPVIKALRDSYPNAYIAMMVSPNALDIVDANPYLDEVIIYDKDGKHKSWMRSVKFARNLKKKRFDLSLILHPTNRVHLISFFAGIPRRIGYDYKLGILLTDRLKHTKQLGEKHELEYNLDLVRYLGIEPEDKSLFMPIKPEAEEWAQGLFRQEGIKNHDKLLAIHPAASCPSKIWPNERFAEVADRLVAKYGFKILVVAGPRDIAIAQNVIKQMHHPTVNLAGKVSVAQLASVLKRCQLFISNDSGPVHIASSLGTPVISIFGRSQKGLSPRRWGPRGQKDRIAYKVVGCVECLAHNCIRNFACLKAVTVDYVLNMADSILACE